MKEKLKELREIIIKLRAGINQSIGDELNAKVEAVISEFEKEIKRLKSQKK